MGTRRLGARGTLIECDAVGARGTSLVCNRIGAGGTPIVHLHMYLQRKKWSTRAIYVLFSYTWPYYCAWKESNVKISVIIWKNENVLYSFLMK